MRHISCVLEEGRFDIAMTAIDNVVAYMEGQGEAKVDREPDIFAFMGGDNGFLSLVTVPEVKTYADLMGRTLSVDALTTGYAFVLLDLLERGGLKRGDFEVVRAGGVLQRWDELKQKKQAGTMLITPFDIIAQAGGSCPAAGNRGLRALRGGPALRDSSAAWLRWVLGSITPPISPRLPA